jgi:hypothetical protein
MGNYEEDKERTSSERYKAYKKLVEKSKLIWV